MSMFIKTTVLREAPPDPHVRVVLRDEARAKVKTPCWVNLANVGTIEAYGIVHEGEVIQGTQLHLAVGSSCLTVYALDPPEWFARGATP